MENENAFKHRVGPELIRRLAAATKAAWTAFDAKSFERAVLPQLEPLELKARIDFVTQQWAARLPSAYPEALPVVLATMGPPLTQDTEVAQTLFYHWTPTSHLSPSGPIRAFTGLWYRQWLATALQSMGLAPSDFEKNGKTGYGDPYWDAKYDRAVSPNVINRASDPIALIT